jgi:hypothetical protein
MTESELKAAFAAFLLDSDKPDPQQRAWDAAMRLYPREKDTGERCRIVFAWPDDPEVILHMRRLQSEKPKEDGIPSKTEVIKELWSLAKHERTLPKDRVACARLVGEMLGLILKAPEDPEGSGRMPKEPVYKIVDR